jgi:CheY-like chemotaxis protein
MPRMLVIDDDAAWRALYRMAFEDHFEIFEATDGQQGLRALEACDPDVILLDLRMPRMDGLDFIRRLGRTQIRGSIVVCSGALNDGERPVIPGVRLAPKNADLRDLWSALLSAVPDLGARGVTAPADDNFWRD